jgi:hypothetical protein
MALLAELFCLRTNDLVRLVYPTESDADKASIVTGHDLFPRSRQISFLLHSRIPVSI